MAIYVPKTPSFYRFPLTLGPIRFPRDLIHWRSYDASARAVAGISMADDVLRKIHMELATARDLRAYPRIAGTRMRRAYGSVYAIDFTEGPRGVVNLLRLSMRDG